MTIPHMTEIQRFTTVLWTNSLVSGYLSGLEIRAARVGKALGDGSLDTERRRDLPSYVQYNPLFVINPSMHLDIIF